MGETYNTFKSELWSTSSNGLILPNTRWFLRSFKFNFRHYSSKNFQEVLRRLDVALRSKSSSKLCNSKGSGNFIQSFSFLYSTWHLTYIWRSPIPSKSIFLNHFSSFLHNFFISTIKNHKPNLPINWDHFPFNKKTDTRSALIKSIQLLLTLSESGILVFKGSSC